jgi:predicted SAM-dependent methyltransferase
MTASGSASEPAAAEAIDTAVLQPGLGARRGLRRRVIDLLPPPTRRALRRGMNRFLGRLTPAEAQRLRRQVLRPGGPGGLTRLQVGCGPTSLLEDWWNVDIRFFPGIDEVADATAPWPWANLDAVYGEHFLEHLPLEGALRFVHEAARSLRPGGVLRLATPSLEHVWLTHFSAAPDRPGETVVAETYRANRAFHGWGHQFLYSRPMLERLLTAAGFGELTFHAYGESELAALRGIERHGGWDVRDGWPSVWIVEGVAGAASRPDGAGGSTPGAPLADGAPTLTLEALADEAETEFIRYVRSGH